MPVSNLHEPPELRWSARVFCGIIRLNLPDGTAAWKTEKSRLFFPPSQVKKNKHRPHRPHRPNSGKTRRQTPRQYRPRIVLPPAVIVPGQGGAAADLWKTEIYAPSAAVTRRGSPMLA
jgi:hypothetical protein